MSDSAKSTEFTRKELIEKCWDEQRAELAFRRDKEQTIFQFSSTVWLAVLGYIAANSSTESSLLRSADWIGRFGMTFVVSIAAWLTNAWIKRQRKMRAGSEQALARIQQEAGCYAVDEQGNSVLPQDFFEYWTRPASEKLRHLSYKRLWAALLPIIVIVCIWLLALTPNKRMETETKNNTKNSSPHH